MVRKIPVEPSTSVNTFSSGLAVSRTVSCRTMENSGQSDMEAVVDSDALTDAVAKVKCLQLHTPNKDLNHACAHRQTVLSFVSVHEDMLVPFMPYEIHALCVPWAVRGSAVGRPLCPYFLVVPASLLSCSIIIPSVS